MQIQRALVIGMGTSGRAAVRLLRHLGAEVHAYDQSTPSDPPEGAKGFYGDATAPDAAYAGIDALVLSPGVPPQPFLDAKDRLAPRAAVHGELGLALSVVHARLRPAWSPRPLVLITGTNGKSTVTALVAALLQADGRTPFCGGNFGLPLCDALVEIDRQGAPMPSEIVLECSSYQLETLPRVPTRVGIVLNVTEDHLDRYRDMEHYARTKAHVFDGLDPDGLALLADDDAWTDAIAPARGTVVRVGGSQARVVGDGEGDRLQLSATESIDRTRLRLRGRHNASNAIFAVLAARHLGVETATCERGLADFEGLPHRMVHVRDLDGVAWYDDSKATNVASALASLGGLSGRFVLIAGGIAKGDDLGPLAALLAARGRAVVGIGRDRDHFLRLAPAGMPAVSADDMPQAVAAARDLAEPGDAVVLAPACASFDQYRNYAERGDAFTAAVEAL